MAIIGQGAFTQGATAVDQVIRVPSGLDALELWNVTQSASGGATTNAVYMKWSRPYVNSSGVVISMDSTGTKGIYNSANAGVLSVGLSAANAFVLFDASGNQLGSLNNGNTGVSAVSNASIPVATVGTTVGMKVGDVVRMYSIAGATQLGGYDFTIGYNTFNGSTTFSLDYMSQIATGTSGNFRVINSDPIFYPSHRFVTKVTKAAQAVVTLSVTHGYKVGQAVRFTVPAAFGMVELDGLVGTIVAINTATTNGNTITVNIDSSAFTAFAFPLTADTPFSPAVVVPVGEDTAQALLSGVNILGDATVNQAYLGMKLAAGALLPAGIASDTVFWQAIKVDFGGL